MSTDHSRHHTTHAKQSTTPTQAELNSEQLQSSIADVLTKGGENNPTSENLSGEDSGSIENLKQQIKELRAQNEEIQAKADETWRKMLDLAADHDNEKKRQHRHAEQKEKFAVERFARDLLPILDSLDRATESASMLKQQVTNADAEASVRATAAMQEGLDLTIKMFEDTLGKHHVQIINPVHIPFDPQYHEAMSMTTLQEFEDNMVVNVIQKGYVLHGRLVRPARVIVNKLK